MEGNYVIELTWGKCKQNGDKDYSKTPSRLVRIGTRRSRWIKEPRVVGVLRITVPGGQETESYRAMNLRSDGTVLCLTEAGNVLVVHSPSVG